MKWLDSFRLSVTEKKGFLALAILLFIGLSARLVVAFWPSNKAEFSSTLNQEIAFWEEEQRLKMLVPSRFDPNLVSEGFINSLALNNFARANWIKFLDRKRKFQSPEDLLSIWGMDTTWFELNRDSIYISEFNDKPSEEIRSKKFYFDPNIATKGQLQELGFPEWLAERIVSYRAKGGKFKQPEDLLKIYDFPESLYKELLPFIRIEKEEEPKEFSPEKFKLVELNSADSLMLLSIKGIGPTFAHRVLERRQKLGGFVGINQLLEIYGFDAERLVELEDQITIDKSLVYQLDINKVSFKELNNHPYLNYNQVKAIVGYREKIGPIKNVLDLINLEGFTEKDIERLKPYLSVK